MLDPVFDPGADSATKEALRDRTALRRGADLLAVRPVSTKLAIEVCTVLRGIDTRIRRIPGPALRNPTTGAIVYTPPEGETRLRTMMSNWERFLHAQEVSRNSCASSAPDAIVDWMGGHDALMDRRS